MIIQGQRRPEGLVDGLVYDLSKVVFAPLWNFGLKYVWTFGVSPVVSAVKDVSEESVIRDAQKQVSGQARIDVLVNCLIEQMYVRLLEIKRQSEGTL